MKALGGYPCEPKPRQLSCPAEKCPKTLLVVVCCSLKEERKPCELTWIESLLQASCYRLLLEQVIGFLLFPLSFFKPNFLGAELVRQDSLAFPWSNRSSLNPLRFQLATPSRGSSFAGPRVDDKCRPLACARQVSVR